MSAVPSSTRSSSVVRTGGSWRILPHDLPPWRIIYYYYARWREAGALAKAPRRAARSGTEGAVKKPNGCDLGQPERAHDSAGRSARLP